MFLVRSWQLTNLGRPFSKFATPSSALPDSWVSDCLAGQKSALRAKRKMPSRRLSSAAAVASASSIVLPTSQQRIRQGLRNLAVIAHVDHGKTTLVDNMLGQSGSGKNSSVLDCFDQERERGITILAKNTAITVKDLSCKINIVDTPGHLDFSGEVQRTLQMVEGFLLLVDAAEGPLPGTHYVLKQALSLNLKPIVMINKVDRKEALIADCEESVSELFLDTAHDAEQLDFPILYGSGRNGWATLDRNIALAARDTPEAAAGLDLTPLFKIITQHVPPPSERGNYPQFLITNLGYDNQLGPLATGRMFSGSLSVKTKEYVVCNGLKMSTAQKITKIQQFDGASMVDVPECQFGDIVQIAGLSQLEIGHTVCLPEFVSPMDYKPIDPPTLSMHFDVNDSPLAGKDPLTKYVQGSRLKERLEKELRTNVALQCDIGTNRAVRVSGRGQLHLSVLVETLRREGYELTLSRPQVVTIKQDGQVMEPQEKLLLDFPASCLTAVMSMVQMRKGDMQNMDQYSDERIRVEFLIPSRGLIGLGLLFNSETKSKGTMNHSFHGYIPHMGEIMARQRGALVSMADGKTTAYALHNLQKRGVMFVGPGELTYPGMVFGEASTNYDVMGNPAKAKEATNVRSKVADEALTLFPARKFNLELAMEWINEDELVEVTPSSIRVFKRPGWVIGKK